LLVQLPHTPCNLYPPAPLYEQPIATAERIIEQGHEHHDHPALLALGHFCAGASSLHRGDLDAAHHHFAMGRRQLDGDVERVTFAVTASHLAVDLPMYGAVAHAASGAADLASAWSDEAISIAATIDQPFSLALANAMGAWTHALVEDPVAARVKAIAALEVSVEHRFDELASIGRLVQGWADARIGAPDGQAAQIEAAVEALEASGVVVGRPVWLGLLADVHVCAGEVQQAAAVRQRARDVVEATGEHGFDRWFELLDAHLDSLREVAADG
jgi:hypothetical protein